MNIEIFIRTIAKNQLNDIHIYVTKESLFEYYELIKTVERDQVGLYWM